MIYKANDISKAYYKRCKKEILKFLFTAPLFIGLMSFLFIIGAKNNFHLIFAIFLLLGLTGFILFSIIVLLKRVNNTITEIIIEDENVKFKTFGILFLSSKIISIKKDKFKLRKQKFNIYKKLEDGWKIRVNNTSIDLINSYFEELPSIIEE